MVCVGRKASELVSERVRPKPGWHRHNIAVNNLSAHVAHFGSVVYNPQGAVKAAPNAHPYPDAL